MGLLILVLSFLLGFGSSFGLFLFVIYVFFTKKATQNEADASKVNYPAFARVLREKHTPFAPVLKEYETYIREYKTRLVHKEIDSDKFIKEKEKERKSQEK